MYIANLVGKLLVYFLQNFCSPVYISVSTFVCYLVSYNQAKVATGNLPLLELFIARHAVGWPGLTTNNKTARGRIYVLYDPHPSRAHLNQCTSFPFNHSLNCVYDFSLHLDVMVIVHNELCARCMGKIDPDVNL